ncbi:MAG: PilZ domain-containing protein [Roseibium sp.]|uniref:PilZ domain-containing protein n=1 Tax=Roseibium sp. TaxID=1936156 RepID=UPI003D9C09D4
MSTADPAPQQDADNKHDEDFTPRERRARVYKKGKMVFQNGLRSIPCVVRNISGGGAMLEFDQPYILPKDFELYIDLEDYEVSCERRWETGLKCGVMFTSERRHVPQKRYQTLSPSDAELQSGFDAFHAHQEAVEHEDGSEDATDAAGASETVPGSGKPSFGRRR